MVRWVDSVKQATNLTEAACWHVAIEVVCRCGNRASYDPHGLWWWFEQRGWDNRIVAARKRFWCKRCHERLRTKVRPKEINLVRESEADIQLPYPDERLWKRVVARMRY